MHSMRIFQMSLNLRKTATTFLTPRGQQRMTDSLHTSMDTLLRLFEGQPSYELASLVENMDGGPEQALELIHEAHMKGLLTTTEGEAPEEDRINLDFQPMASYLNMRKTAEYTYSAQLLGEMISGYERDSLNFTASGAEAVILFQGEGLEPQRYHITVNPIYDDVNPSKDSDQWGPEGPPSGISNV